MVNCLQIDTKGEYVKHNLISQIIRGECGQDFFRMNERCEKIMDKFCEHYELLQKLLENNKPLLQEYEKVIETYDEFCAAQAEEYYKEGFAFGVKLGLEIAAKD